MRKKEPAIKYYAIKYYKEADGGTNWNLTVKIGIQNRKPHSLALLKFLVEDLLGS